jgi:hypothetical protein
MNVGEWAFSIPSIVSIRKLSLAFLFPFPLFSFSLLPFSTSTAVKAGPERVMKKVTMEGLKDVSEGWKSDQWLSSEDDRDSE